MEELMVHFGRKMREDYFDFDPHYTPLNHGSYGTFPRIIRDYMRELQDLTAAKPDTFIRCNLPELLIKSRKAISPLLGVSANEVVFVPNATTGVNTVLRNLVYGQGDVILYFSTIYGACQKTVSYICETTLAESVCVELMFPMEDDAMMEKFIEMVETVKAERKTVKIAIFDTVLTFPGVRMPWERLVKACKDLGILSLIDGAHGIGHIDLTKLGEVGPDFFTSNCYKWLYTPRGCAIFYVPFRNQYLIRTSLPTSHGFRPMLHDSTTPPPTSSTSFAELFAFVATIDNSPYMTVPKALEFRQKVCGGEESIRNYCQQVAQAGGAKVAKILGTEVMGNATQTLQQCCFSNVRLPLRFTLETTSISENSSDGRIHVSQAPHIVEWIKERALKDFETYFTTKFHNGAVWVRFSGQVYLEEQDIEWAGLLLKTICERVMQGEWREEVAVLHL